MEYEKEVFIMNKFKVNTLLIIISLLVGIFINKDVAEVKTNNIISTTKATNKTVYHMSYDVSQVEFCDSLIKDTYNAKIYDTNELNTETLTNRNGRIIIEKVIGKVTNDSLDGKILNCIDEQHDYISYKNVAGAKKNDTVLTYFIYNPSSNVEDDVLTRINFIIDGNII
jgi:hypothetical protein